MCRTAVHRPPRQERRAPAQRPGGVAGPATSCLWVGEDPGGWSPGWRAGQAEQQQFATPIVADAQNTPMDTSDVLAHLSRGGCRWTTALASSLMTGVDHLFTTICGLFHAPQEEAVVYRALRHHDDTRRRGRPPCDGSTGVDPPRKVSVDVVLLGCARSYSKHPRRDCAGGPGNKALRAPPSNYARPPATWSVWLAAWRRGRKRKRRCRRRTRAHNCVMRYAGDGPALGVNTSLADPSVQSASSSSGHAGAL